MPSNGGSPSTATDFPARPRTANHTRSPADLGGQQRTDRPAHHVRTGVATFEVDPPDARERRRRFHAVIDNRLTFVSAGIDAHSPATRTACRGSRDPGTGTPSSG